jgi:hypothetical protein
MDINGSVTCSQEPATDPILSQTNPNPTSQSYFCRIHSYLHEGLLRDLFPSVFLQELSSPVRSTCPESESYVTTDGQPASLSLNKAPFWGLRPDLYYCLTVAGLLILGALSDERTGLSFTISAGPRQGSHFRVRVP